MARLASGLLSAAIHRPAGWPGVVAFRTQTLEARFVFSTTTLYYLLTRVRLGDNHRAPIKVAGYAKGKTDREGRTFLLSRLPELRFARAMMSISAISTAMASAHVRLYHSNDEASLSI